MRSISVFVLCLLIYSPFVNAQSEDKTIYVVKGQILTNFDPNLHMGLLGSISIAKTSLQDDVIGIIFIESDFDLDIIEDDIYSEGDRVYVKDGIIITPPEVEIEDPKSVEVVKNFANDTQWIAIITL